MEEVRSGPLYKAYYGHARLGAIQDRVVIDRCAAETGVLEWTVTGGGTRNAGLRPRRIDPGILSNRASFFQGLRASIAEVGVKVPVLLWGIKGRLWLRYGASRYHVADQLGFLTIPAILCNYDSELPSGFLAVRPLSGPQSVLEAFGPPSEVGHFIVDHEKIDAHRLEP